MRSTSRAMTKAMRIFNTDPILISILIALTAIPVALSIPWWAKSGFVIAAAFFFWLLRKQFLSDPRKAVIFMRTRRLKAIYDPGKRRRFQIQVER